MINVTVWNEYRHEKTDEGVRKIYPKGIHGAVGDALAGCGDINITYATLDDPDHGLPDEVLNNTDVLTWWGHMAHHEVSDALVAKIKARVYNGMGLICLHSAHASKVFTSVVGTNGNLQWGDDMREVVWCTNQAHPIAAGVPDHFVLPIEELYAEPFRIPTPDDVIFTSWFENGYIFRSGCTFTRGVGKIFYFQPGHEFCPTLHNPVVQRIIKNAVYWVAPNEFGSKIEPGCNYTDVNLSRD